MRVALYTLILSFAFTPFAQAGFEWVPPSQNPQQRGAPQFDFPVAPPATRDRVTAEPLPAFGNTIYETKVQRSVRPQSPSLANPNFQTGGRITNNTIGNNNGNKGQANTRPNLQNPQNKPVSLYINPYPLGRNNTGTGAAVVSNLSIEQAMIQQTGHVTPMPLGNGMQTGGQVAFESMPAITAPAKAMMIEKIDSIPMRAPTPIIPTINRAPAQQFAPQFAEAEGFGTALPLALALSQVIPSEFTHNFAVGVDPGTTVSWQGGKAWNLVLEDMLRPSGLTASIQNNAVTIQPLARL